MEWVFGTRQVRRSVIGIMCRKKKGTSLLYVQCGCMMIDRRRAQEALK